MGKVISEKLTSVTVSSSSSISSEFKLFSSSATSDILSVEVASVLAGKISVRYVSPSGTVSSSAERDRDLD